MSIDNKVPSEIPLCVDLDGTLIRTDSLMETAAFFTKQFPIKSLLFPIWLLKGRAYFKEKIASQINLDVAYLPYEQQVIQTIQDARNSGRNIILCTGANNRYAKAVSDHLGLFDDVIASDETTNLTYNEKSQALIKRFGSGGYDYIGNDAKDLPVFCHARKSFLVSPTRLLCKKKSKLENVEILVPRIIPSFRSYLLQIRLHQWLKNILIFIAPLAAHRLDDWHVILAIVIGFLAFGFCASSIYVLNDLMDLSSDRRHPRKRLRPLASGNIPIVHGFLMFPILAIIGFGLTSFMGIEFILMVLLYCLISLNYNLWVKNLAVLDTIFLAGLYTLRIIAGAVAINVEPSFWLLAFSMFFFLSVALAKRYSELISLELVTNEKVPGRGYQVIDLNTLISQGAASGYSAILVIALYINSNEVLELYRHPQILWLTCPLLLYWINKLWLNSQRGEVHDDPLVWAIENRVSRGIAIMLTLILIMAI